MKAQPNFGPLYPTFGSVMEGRSFVGDTSAWYRFGFGGQLKDDEIYGKGNTYSAEYWEYDARVGRRWNVDPEGIEWQSPYSVLRNSPILFIDPKGNIWDPAHEGTSESEAQKLENKAKNSKESAAKSISKYDKHIKRLLRRQSFFGESQRRSGKINYAKERVGELKQDIAHYDNTLSEINEMRSHPDFIYRLKSHNENTLNGQVYYDGGVIVIKYPENHYDLMAQEMKHGHQIITGDVDLNKISTDAGLLLDIGDEIASYQRGLAYSFDLSKPLYNQINRDYLIKRKTSYAMLPTENLTVNSTIGTLKRVHGNNIKMSQEFFRERWREPYRDLGDINSKYDSKKLSEFKVFKYSLIINY